MDGPPPSAEAPAEDVDALPVAVLDPDAFIAADAVSFRDSFQSSSLSKIDSNVGVSKDKIFFEHYSILLFFYYNKRNVDKLMCLFLLFNRVAARGRRILRPDSSEICRSRNGRN